MKLIKIVYHFFYKIFYKIKFYLSVNWIKTIYFNFKMLSFNKARKLPVIFYGPVRFTSLKGTLLIEAPIKKGMIGFGQRFELSRKHKGYAELTLDGTLVFNGNAHIGKDCFFHVGKDAYCEFGFMGCLGSDVRLICKEKIIIGNWAGIGYESQITDSNYHPMKNTKTEEYYAMTKPIIIGDYNSFANRISIMNGTMTPNHCVIASNSVCNKDYRGLGNNILIGGVPAKLIKENYARDWELEKGRLLRNKIRWQDYKDFL